LKPAEWLAIDCARQIHERRRRVFVWHQRKTAETHRTRLVQKPDIHETASLLRYAVRQGIVQP
jgi:hypothetical protein